MQKYSNCDIIHKLEIYFNNCQNLIIFAPVGFSIWKMIGYINLLAVLLAILIVFFSLRKYRNNLYLAGLLMSFGLWGIISQSILFTDHHLFPAILFIHFNPILYLLGPMLYFYVKSLITENFKHSAKDLVHIILPIIILIGIFPYYFKSLDYKEEVVRYISENYSYSDQFQINWMIPHRFTEIFRVLTYMFYVVLSLHALQKSKLAMIKRKSILGVAPLKLYNWLLFLMINIFTVSVLYLIVGLSLSHLIHLQFRPGSLNAVSYLIRIFYLASIVGLFFMPNVLYGLSIDHPHADAPGNKPDQEGDEKLNLFTDEYVERISTSLEQIESSDEFLDEGFNKSRLSTLIKIPEHHITYYFNSVRNQRFTDWKNELRIKRACHILENEFDHRLSLDVLAGMCGYQHQSTFFAAFKKFTSKTPKEFLISIRQDQMI